MQSSKQVLGTRRAVSQLRALLPTSPSPLPWHPATLWVFHVCTVCPALTHPLPGYFLTLQYRGVEDVSQIHIN